MSAELIDLLTPILPFLMGFLTAVFAEPFRKWLTQPRLKVWFKPKFGEGIGSISLTPERERRNGQKYFICALVKNLSRTIARNCRAYLIRIDYKSNQQEKYLVIHQDPIPLDWAFLGDVQLDLPPQLEFYFDVFSVSNFDDIMIPRTVVSSWIWTRTLIPTGQYRYTVGVAGESISPLTTSITFDWDSSFAGLDQRREDCFL